GNVISGNPGDGVAIDGAVGNAVAGNRIGVQAPGTAGAAALPLPNGRNGVSITAGFNNLIGGFNAGMTNIIAFNPGAGVLVNSGAGTAILQDSIYNNPLGGIVLRPGANGNQPAPTLTGVTRGPRVTVITGTLVAAPNSAYHIELFANPAGDP